MNIQYLTTILIVFAVTAVLLIVRRMLFRFFRGLAKKTVSRIDDLLLDGLEGPSTLLILTLAVYISIRLSELPERYVAYVVKAVYLSLILTVTMGLANVSGRMTAYFLKKVDLPFSVTSLLHAVTKAIVYAVGILMMLNAVGLSIAPIITALGVGGLAMALALGYPFQSVRGNPHSCRAHHTDR